MSKSIIATHYFTETELLDLITHGLAELIQYCRTRPKVTSEEADAYTDIADRLVAIVGTESPPTKGHRP